MDTQPTEENSVPSPAVLPVEVGAVKPKPTLVHSKGKVRVWYKDSKTGERKERVIE